jgi:hypothetical protein
MSQSSAFVKTTKHDARQIHSLTNIQCQNTRRSPRFPFIAIAEIAYRESEEGLSCRVITLSLHRCYVDMPNTLPIGREVSIKIFAESECFAATAKVIYELAKLGDRTCVRGSIVKKPSAFT